MMNERIRELALQANPASKEIYESDNWEYNCAAWCAQDLEKFAELIVRQMLDVTDAHTEVFQTDRDKALIEHIKQSVKTHFGVEE